MVLKAFIISSLLWLSSCSTFHYNHKDQKLVDFLNLKASALTKTQIKILKNDLLVLKSMGLDPKFMGMLEGLRDVYIHPHHCSAYQLACAYPGQREAIYLRPAFFSLKREERISTLIHESAHHRYGYDHIKCLKDSSYECDKTLESPYGIEVELFKAMKEKGYLKAQRADELTQAYLLRINWP